MRRRALALVLAAVLAGAAGAPAETVHVTGQLLAYQDGYVFFSNGDGFRVAPNVTIRDVRSGGVSKVEPRPRLYARAIFDAQGNVTELDLSQRPLPAEMDFASVHQFAVAASSPVPNPDLAPGQVPAGTAPSATAGKTFTGRLVLVSFVVQVPAQTPAGSTVYITTDVSGWNAQAIRMQRVDALHFRVTQYIVSGTVFNYLYTRGSLQTEERAQNGLSREPRQIVVSDSDVKSENDTVWQWADLELGTQITQPNAIPTPFSNNPFPNLPPGQPTPHP